MINILTHRRVDNSFIIEQSLSQNFWSLIWIQWEQNKRNKGKSSACFRSSITIQNLNGKMVEKTLKLQSFTAWRQGTAKGCTGGQGPSSSCFCGSVLPGLRLQDKNQAPQDPPSRVTYSSTGQVHSSKELSRTCCCLLKGLVSSNFLWRP